jgi:GTP cyclohydrolase II
MRRDLEDENDDTPTYIRTVAQEERPGLGTGMHEKLASVEMKAEPALRHVDRVLGELRRGTPVLLRAPDGRVALVLSAETVDDPCLAILRKKAKAEPLLIITARRAMALGLEEGKSARKGADPVALRLLDRSATRVLELTDPSLPRARSVERPLVADAPADLAPASVDLMKLARLLPAALLAMVDGESAKLLENDDLLLLETEEVTAYRLAASRTLSRVGEAKVPLEGAENARVIAYRPPDGGVEHLAIVIGEPKADSPLLARLHSECFTGDLLGSLRCDCGDQLRGAIQAIGALGAGVLLYLAQEGRGIGLVNKLRAYSLQDRGADTLEANEQLGFDADERVYLPAAAMLRDLGFHQVNLLTNNPEKVEALERCGIEVISRVPHAFPSNRHNEAYLDTKVRKFGHLF